MVALKQKFNPETVYDELSRHTNDMLVIFDADGVLYDYERALHNAAYDILSEFNQNMPDKIKFFNYLAGVNDYDLLNKVKKFFKINALPFEGPNSFNWMYHIKQSQLFEEMESQIVEGVFELLNELQIANVRFCLATRSRLEPLKIKLKKTELNIVFNENNIFHSDGINDQMVTDYARQHGISPDVLDKDKTSVFIAAAASFGYNPEDCFVIEDTLGGVQSALNAKMNIACFTGAPSTNKQATINKVSTILAEEFIFDSLI